MLRFSKEISLTDICNFLIIKICKKWNLHNIRRFFQLDHCNSILRFFQILKQNGFSWIQGSTYLSESDDMGHVVKAIMDLSKINWFKKSVRDIRGYKVENWSNFTDIVRNA